MDEYQAIFATVNSFDERLLIIKGWAVTFTLATLVLAFEKKNKNLFTVALLSSLCFWVLEAETKKHQTKYYYRMAALEISKAGFDGAPNDKGCFVRNGNKGFIDSVLIDWSWREPTKALTNEICMRKPLNWYSAYIYPHIAIPHVFIVLFCLFFIFRKRVFNGD